jgi:hypothetical protein
MLTVVILLSFIPAVMAQRGPGGSKSHSGPTALSVTDLTGPITATDLAESLAGAGISVSAVTYTGADPAAGSFSGGDGIIGFPEGIVLSSGSVVDVVGPNEVDDVSTIHGTPGDSDLDTLSGGTTNDAAILEFDFVPDGDSINFRYVFASDEYNEFVNTAFNDVFAFYVNGENCALVEGDPVTINTINNGNPFGMGTITNPEYYVNNDCDDGGCPLDTEMDGKTVILTCNAEVTPDATNHLKLAIADTTDAVYDAAVFIEGGSITTVTDVSLSSFSGDSNPWALPALFIALLIALGLTFSFRLRRTRQQ